MFHIGVFEGRFGSLNHVCSCLEHTCFGQLGSEMLLFVEVCIFFVISTENVLEIVFMEVWFIEVMEHARDFVTSFNFRIICNKVWYLCDYLHLINLLYPTQGHELFHNVARLLPICTLRSVLARILKFLWYWTPVDWHLIPTADQKIFIPELMDQRLNGEAVVAHFPSAKVHFLDIKDEDGILMKFQNDSSQLHIVL